MQVLLAAGESDTVMGESYVTEKRRGSKERGGTELSESVAWHRIKLVVFCDDLERFVKSGLGYVPQELLPIHEAGEDLLVVVG